MTNRKVEDRCWMLLRARADSARKGADEVMYLLLICGLFHYFIKEKYVSWKWLEANVFHLLRKIEVREKKCGWKIIDWLRARVGVMVIMYK